jgi:hypothetical protein
MISMVVAAEVERYLETFPALRPIKVGNLDASPDVIGVILEYGGQKPERGFGVRGIQFEKPALQILFRGAPHDYAGPMTKARIAWDELAKVQPGTLFTGSAVYHQLDPQQSPFSLGQDTAKRFEIVCNYYIMKEP